MKLSKYTEYAFSLLVFLATNADKQERFSLKELAEALNITKHNLAQITRKLVELNMLNSFPGWTGGVTLKKTPEEIKLGDVLKAFEPDTDLENRILLELILSAEVDFLSKLNTNTLADLIKSIG